MTTQVLTSRTQILSWHPKPIWLTRGGGYGGDFLPWKRRLEPAEGLPFTEGFQGARWGPQDAAGGFGGDYIPWKSLAAVRPPDPAPDPGSIRFGWAPQDAQGGYGGDYVPWKQPLPKPPDPPLDPGTVGHWLPSMVAGGYGGDQLAWRVGPAVRPPDPEPDPGRVTLGLGWPGTQAPPPTPTYDSTAALWKKRQPPYPWEGEPGGVTARWGPQDVSGGYGGDFLPWKTLPAVRPPDPPADPGRVLLGMGWPGTQVPPPSADSTAALWRKRQPPYPWEGENGCQIARWGVYLIAGGYGGDFLPWRTLVAVRPPDPAPDAGHTLPGIGWLGTQAPPTTSVSGGTWYLRDPGVSWVLRDPGRTWRISRP
jgi:hypothetical protein